MGAEDRNRYVAAGLLAAAAAVHLAAAYEPEHLENQLFFGFFWIATAAQAALALALLGSIRGAAHVAFGVNVFLIGLWAVTRVVALPGEDRAEPVELLGLLAKGVEVASLPFLFWLAGGSPRMTGVAAGTA